MSRMRNSSQLLFSLKYYFSDCRHSSQTIILAETQISRKLLFLYAITDWGKIGQKLVQYSQMNEIWGLGGWFNGHILSVFKFIAFRVTIAQS